MSKFEELYASLNSQQKVAVDTIEGPVLVVAGPGTGKTQVLAMRIANILRKTDAKPSDILCITFTESGVLAMRKRLQRIVSKDAYYIHIHTFHGFCNEVIQTFPEKFPQFAGSPVQLDDLGRIKLIRRVIDDLSEKLSQLRPFHNKYQYQNEIIAAIQNLKKEGVDAQKFVSLVSDELEDLKQSPKLKKNGEPTLDHQKEVRNAEKNVELSNIYERYQQLLGEESYYDYEDMVIFVINKFEEDEELLAYYQEKFLYVLVDEYQDTNQAQNQIIKHLGSFDSSPNIFAVGDDDQAIYRFQGANVENLLFFNKQFKNVKVISIDTNYRSGEGILRAAMDSISHNEQRLTNLVKGVEKELKAGSVRGKHKPQVFTLSTGEKENEFVARKIEELVEGGAKHNEIAVVYRRHADAEDLIDMLLRVRVPLHIIGGSNALNEAPVRQLVTLLRLVNYDPAEQEKLLTEALLYEFTQKKFGYSNLDVYKLLKHVGDRNYRARSEATRVDTLTQIGDLKLLSEIVDSPVGLYNFSQALLEWRQSAANNSLTNFVAMVMDQSGLLTHYLSGDVNVDELNALNSFFSYIKHLNLQNKDITLAEFMEDMKLLGEQKVVIKESQLDTKESGVQLMTAHGAKGLEFKYVFIIKCYHGNWGGRRSSEKFKLPKLTESQAGDNDIKKDLSTEDERRLFYVALTRAEEQVFISHAKQYQTSTAERVVEPSQFIAELSDDVIEMGEVSKYENLDLEILSRKLSPVLNLKLKEKEADYLKQLVVNFRLSASALNDYIRCPLEFKFTRLLRIPSPPNRYFALGTATHKALEQLMRKLMATEEVSLEYVLTVFRSTLDKELLGGEEFAEVLAEGTKILTEYYSYYGNRFTAPAEVEYFVRAVPLELDGQEPVLITGKIDKAEWLDKREGTIKVIDYKTSSPVSENQIRGEVKSNPDKSIWRQLVFYKLLTDLDPNFKPKGKLGKYKMQSAEIDFLKPKDGRFRKVEVEIKQSDVDELKEKINDVVARIRNLEFYGTEEYPLCNQCDYCKFYVK